MNVQEGAGSIAVPDAVTTLCTIGTTARYRPTNSAITTENIEILPAVAGARTFLRLQTPAGEYVELQQRTSALYFVTGDSTGSSAPGPVSSGASGHRYWRIREEGGTTYWESATVRGEWVIHHSAVTPFSADEVQVRIGTHTTTTTVPEGRFRFDNVNL